MSNPAERALPMLPPGATIGILGGGQLGRMAALAAARLGYRCHIFCPEHDAPALQVTPFATVADYGDHEALAGFARSVDLVTFEFENVPGDAAEFLAQRVACRPDPQVLRICQNRLREKDFCRAARVPTTSYAEVGGPEALVRSLEDIGTPAVLKTVEFGYDGRGQVQIRPETNPLEAWQALSGGQPDAQAILEGFVDFRIEISVIVARAADGTCRAFPVAENHHRNHILDQTIVPARVDEQVAHRAEAIARHLAEEIGLIGLLAVEMFVTAQGEVLVNELAPRPHNSGHWSIDACATSQFEQFIRAVAGLPLGSTEALCDATMKNLLGDEVGQWPEILKEPAAKLHLYGKAEARPGRKMGHVTRLQPKRGDGQG